MPLFNPFNATVSPVWNFVRGMLPQFSVNESIHSASGAIWQFLRDYVPLFERIVKHLPKKKINTITQTEPITHQPPTDLMKAFAYGYSLIALRYSHYGISADEIINLLKNNKPHCVMVGMCFMHLAEKNIFVFNTFLSMERNVFLKEKLPGHFYQLYSSANALNRLLDAPLAKMIANHSVAIQTPQDSERIPTPSPVVQTQPDPILSPAPLLSAINSSHFLAVTTHIESSSDEDDGLIVSPQPS
jgi:hypothetical protein